MYIRIHTHICYYMYMCLYICIYIYIEREREMCMYVCIYIYIICPDANILGPRRRVLSPAAVLVFGFACGPRWCSCSSWICLHFSIYVCVCVSSLRRGHANLLCVAPSLTDDPRRKSDVLALDFPLAPLRAPVSMRL